MSSPLDETSSNAHSTAQNGAVVSTPGIPKPPLINARILGETEFEPVVATVPGLLYPGHALLAGKVKHRKAQPLDALVATPHGWKQMGDIAPGDLVLGADGKPTQVVAVHPQGIQFIYRIQLAEGCTVEATPDHLWAVDVTIGGSPLKRKILTTEEIVQLKRTKKTAIVYIPTCAPIEGNQMLHWKVHPYLLGALLGDGGLTKNVILSFGDNEIIEHIKPLLPEGVTAKLNRTKNAVTLSSKRGSENMLLTRLREYGVFGVKSHEKTIPHEFMNAPLAIRFALVQGLLDTDGHAAGGNRIGFCTTSPLLARQFYELIRSLGGTCSLYSRLAKYNGRQHKRTYEFNVRLPRELGSPFRLSRKRAVWHKGATSKKRQHRQRIVSIEYSRFAQAQCITVAAPDGLYLTNHYIVTHNSWLSLQFAIAVATGSSVLGRECRQGECLVLALEDTPRRLQNRMSQLMPGDGPWPEGLWFATSWPRMGEGATRLFHDWMQKHPRTRLIIVDTLAKIRPPMRSEYSYQGDYQVGGEVKAIADRYSITILSVAHLRKMPSDDPVEQISGTTGLTASVDGIMVMSTNSLRQRADLHVTGKDVEEEADLVLRRDAGTAPWYVDPNAQLQTKRERQQIYAALASNESSLTSRQIFDFVHYTDETVQYDAIRKRVQRMLEDGEITQVGGDRKRGYEYVLTPKGQENISLNALLS